MRIAVTGANGRLGTSLLEILGHCGHDVVALSRSGLDVTNREAVERTLSELMPEVVIYAAAYTAVDAAEDDVEACMAVNARGAENVASICTSIGAKLVYPSTDYVFSGSGSQPHRTDDPVAPVNVYGVSKLAGERAVLSLVPRSFVIRTSWLFGFQGSSFVRSILNIASRGSPFGVVNDQIGSPTYTHDLATLIADMIVTDKYGLYHAVGSGSFVSKYEFAQEILRLAGMDTAMAFPVSSEKYGARASRPLNGRLETSSLSAAGFELLPDWRQSLGTFFASICGGKENGNNKH